MESSKTLLFVLLVIMALAFTDPSATQADKEPEFSIKKDNTDHDDLSLSKHEESYFLQRTNRFLASREVKTCDKYPTVCRAKGSPGPYCCKKQCVNVMIDNLNCGKCGKKCGYSKVCCRGTCVNTSVDEKNCGRCNNKCKKGSSCTYGMCSYA